MRKPLPDGSDRQRARIETGQSRRPSSSPHPSSSCRRSRSSNYRSFDDSWSCKSHEVALLNFFTVNLNEKVNN